MAKMGHLVKKAGLFMVLWFRRVLRVLAAAMVLVAGFGVAPSIASHDHDEVLQAAKNGEIRPLVEILNTVQNKLPGDVVRTKLEKKDGLWIYEFRAVNREGQLFDVHVDAHSGEIKRMRKK
jgi:hypothetical protein